MTIRNNIIHVEINKGIYRTSGVTIAMGDKYAERFGARITQDGEALNLEGARVQGLFIRADYKTIILEGATEGDTVYVDLSPECYAVMGSFALAIKIIVDERVTTIRMIDGNAKVTSTGNENTFPTVDSPTLADLISRIEALEQGGGSGGSGAPGGYYMPGVSQPNDTTMRVSFEPSNSGMPGVLPVDVTLPQGQPGDPGFSPLIDVAKVGSVVTITITDVNYTKSITINDGVDGTPGKTPVKGADYFTPADQEAIVQQVIAALGTPVFGTVDADNNILLTGELAEGAYILRYEDAEGNLTQIGELRVGGYTNLADASSSDWLKNSRFNSSLGITTHEGALITNYIPVKAGDVVRVKGLDIGYYGTNFHAQQGARSRLCMYTADKAAAYASVIPTDSGVASLSGDEWTYTIATGFSGDASAIRYVRFCGDLYTGYGHADVIITVNEPIV